MPTYKVVFTNGEKRELVIKASRIDEKKPNLLRLMRDDNGSRVVATIPIDRVLYIVEVPDESE